MARCLAEASASPVSVAPTPAQLAYREKSRFVSKVGHLAS